MTWSKRTFLGLMLSGAALSVWTPVTLAQGADKKRLVILGDSITAGYGLTREEAYPALIQQKLDAEGLAYEVVNAGVSGDTTAGGLRRIDWALGQKGADVLVIALGGNDGLRGVPPAQTESNLNGIIQKAKAKIPDIKIVVAGMQMPDSMGARFVEAYKALFPRVASAHQTAFMPFLLEGVGGKEELNLPDRIHPNPEGQKIIAENLWKVLQDVVKE